MSTTQDTDQDVTEHEFVEAMLSILECGFALAFEECNYEVYTAAIFGRHTIVFSAIRDKHELVRTSFAQKVLAHQANTDDAQEDTLYADARGAVELDEYYEKIVENIETVTRYCDQQNILTTDIRMKNLMASSRSYGVRTSPWA